MLFLSKYQNTKIALNIRMDEIDENKLKEKLIFELMIEHSNSFFLQSKSNKWIRHPGTFSLQFLIIEKRLE